MKLTITGYDDLNKVMLTKVFREYSGHGLAGSKKMTDDLLREGHLDFEVSDEIDSRKLLECLLNANANITYFKK